MNKRLIVVVPYDAKWPELFANEAQKIAAVLPHIALHHIGSTAIPNMAAKPVIDMILEVADIKGLDQFNADMVRLGYIPKGEYGIPGRRFFLKGESERTHHIHAFQKGNPQIARHLNFRDFMIAHPEEAAAYARLKSELAFVHKDNNDAYCDGKDAFIREIDRRAALWVANVFQEEAISSLRMRLTMSPEDHPLVILPGETLSNSAPLDALFYFRIAAIFDCNGFASEACKWYERTQALGLESLPPKTVPHFYVCYGSTLRNVGRLADSEKTLRLALAKWPNFSALQFFLGLTLMSQGCAMEALVALSELQVGNWDDTIKLYSRAVEFYLRKELRPMAAKPTLSVARMVVNDVNASSEWYKNVLELSPVIQIENFSLFRWGASQLEITRADDKNPVSTGGTIAYWHVHSLSEWIERLQRQGATLFRGPLEIPDEGLTICQMKDPFGNVLGFQARLEKK